ncbi:hypothetical protein SAMN05216377_1331, partial [Pseudonocardia oroxyli]
ESEGQRRMRALHAGRYDGSARSLEIAPNLWASPGRLPDPGLAAVPARAS